VSARPALLDDPSDLSALRAKGTDPDELFASFAVWAEESGTVLYPAQEKAPAGSGKSLEVLRPPVRVRSRRGQLRQQHGDLGSDSRRC